MVSHWRVIALVAVGVVRRRRTDELSLPVAVAVGSARIDGRLRIILLFLLLFFLGVFVFVDVIEVEVVLHVRLLRLVHGV